MPGAHFEAGLHSVRPDCVAQAKRRAWLLQAEQLLDGRAAPLLQHVRSFHACRWLAAEAQPQAPAPAIPMSTELHAYDVRTPAQAEAYAP